MERECSSYIKYPLIGLVLSFLFSATVLSAGMNDYDYFKRVSAGTEELAMPAYKGVPGKTRQEVMQVIKQSYEMLGERPIADTCALYWHTKKSDLSKVAQQYCDLRTVKGSSWHKACLTKGTADWDRRFKSIHKANAGFETASLKGLISVTEGLWADTKNNHHLKVTAHEYFHVYQGMMLYYFGEEDRIGIPRMQRESVRWPVWMDEGGAEYFAYNVLGKHKRGSYRYWMDRALRAAKNEISQGKKKGVNVVLKNFETRTQLAELEAKGLHAHFQYEGGAWANAYLRYLTGTNDGVFMNFYTDIAELERAERKKGKTGQGWQRSFEKNFGMTVNQFYTKFDKFMKQSSAAQMKILDYPGVIEKVNGKCPEGTQNNYKGECVSAPTIESPKKEIKAGGTDSACTIGSLEKEPEVGGTGSAPIKRGDLSYKVNSDVSGLNPKIKFLTCEEVTHRRSGGGSTKVNVEITPPSSLQETLKLRWVDFNGKENDYHTITTRPVRQGTVLGHVWIIRLASGECLEGFVIE